MVRQEGQLWTRPAYAWREAGLKRQPAFEVGPRAVAALAGGEPDSSPQGRRPLDLVYESIELRVGHPRDLTRALGIGPGLTATAEEAHRNAHAMAMAPVTSMGRP